MIITASEGKLCSVSNGKLSWYNSQHVTAYKQNLESITQRKAWKTQGTGAMFRGAYEPLRSKENAPIGEIFGLSFAANGDVIYSLKVETSSGIFSKSLEDSIDAEGHIIHKHDTEFYGLDFNKETQQLVVSISDGWGRHLALFNNNSAIYTMLTEGDSRDENPTWSRTASQTVFYDSCGIGKDKNGLVAGFGPRTIQRLDLNSGQVDELAAVTNCNCLAPREDNLGNIYFLQRPAASSKRHFWAILLDILLIPLRILKALFNWANIFTMRYSGETLVTPGENPANARQKKPEETFIEGNLINVQKTLKANAAKGEKYPGLIPKDWKLMKLSPSGAITPVKSGVLSYDIDNDGRIVYSNGLHLLKVNSSGSEEHIATVKMANPLRIK